jgi:hypothetical protein
MNRTLTTHPQIESLRARASAIEESLVALQRETARPVPVQFKVRRIVSDKANPAN